MSEEEARQVLLLQAVETAAAAPLQPGRMPEVLWSAEDARWATQQAAAAVGEDAGAQRFVVARAALALQRLLPRDAAAQRWLARRGWHPAWLLLALLLGGVAGVLADQLGPPQRVNLLAPAVWAVVAWNLAVYLVMLLPLPSAGPAGLRGWLAGLGLRGPGGNGATAAAGALWARHAAGLMAHRAALVLHGAAAALALGLVAGLYLRGLVLDYRAGWQSTFLDAATVQQALGWLLAPAAWFTGVAVPEVAPLRLAPGTDATASAAPWIHLYATTLVLAVVLPRGLLALWAARRAAALSQRFPLALDTPYFEALHPLMRPGRPRVLRLLWVPAAGQPPAALFDTPLAPWPADGGPLTLLRSEQDDELQLLPAPATLAAVPEPPPPWWAWKWPPWRRSPADPLPALREQVAAALLLTAPGAPRPPWLARLERPVVVLVDGEAAAEAGTAEGGIPLHQRADGWLPEGRLLQALAAALEDDRRLHRLADAWKARQAARFDALVAELAHTLAELACTHEAVAEDTGLFARRGEAAAAEAAREQLVQTLEAAALAHGERLQALLQPPPDALAAPQAGEGAAVPAQVNDGAAARAPAREGGTLRAQTGEGSALHAQTGEGSALRAQVSEGFALRSQTGEGFTLRARVGEGRAALMGGVLSGALAGLKADVLSGGLTMGAGAVAGAVVGGLASAGAARGLNLVRGTDRSFVAWDEAALARITETLLRRTLVAAYGLAPDAAAAALAPALAARQPALATLWRARQRQFHNPGEAQALALTLQSPLADTLVQALGGPGRA